MKKLLIIIAKCIIGILCITIAWFWGHFYYNLPIEKAFLLLAITLIVLVIIEMLYKKYKKKSLFFDTKKLAKFNFVMWLVFVIVVTFISFLVLIMLPQSLGMSAEFIFAIFVGLFLGTRLYIDFGLKSEEKK